MVMDYLYLECLIPALTVFNLMVLNITMLHWDLPTI